uniref:Uncharacterized protein n=1 Tax=Anopheles coluzzii TaxID=1518534 RepID=A0A8W7P1I3_ANOCL
MSIETGTRTTRYTTTYRSNAESSINISTANGHRGISGLVSSALPDNEMPKFWLVLCGGYEGSQALQLDADEGLHDAAPNEAYYLDQSSQIASNQVHQIDYRAQKRHVGAGPGATLLPADSVVDCGGGGGGGVGGVGCVVTT